jgi:hypothetical protein
VRKAAVSCGKSCCGLLSCEKAESRLVGTTVALEKADVCWKMSVMPLKF